MNRSGILVISLLTWLLQPAELRANVIGSDFRNFNPSLSAVDVTTVHTGRTIGQGRLGLGLFIDHAVNTLPYFNDPGAENRDSKKEINDYITGVEMQAVYGLNDRWDLALAAPYIVYQSFKEDGQPHGYFARLGNTELRISSKVALVQGPLFNLAVVGTANYNRVENNPYTGNVKWPSQSLELVSSLGFGLVEWSLNAGYRWRTGRPDLETQKTLPINPFVDQLLGSSALAFDLPSTELDVITEIFGAYAHRKLSSVSPRDPSVLEGQVGLRYPLPLDLQWHGGVGSELKHSVSSADIRFFTGVRWTVDTRSAPAAPDSDSPPVKPLAPQVVLASITERAPDRIFEIDDVYFMFDSTEIRDPAGYKIMDSLASALQKQEIERVVIEGHTCAMGSDSYNIDLSDRRAAAIERWLIVNNRVPPEKLLSVGWGEKQLKVRSPKEEIRMLNRRVTFKVFYAPTRAPAPTPTPTLPAH